jgi:hypothetical protein
MVEFIDDPHYSIAIYYDPETGEAIGIFRHHPRERRRDGSDERPRG